MSEPEPGEATAETGTESPSPPDDDGGCCVPEEEMIVARDLNLDYPWKGGNQYCRICPECWSRTFTAKSYWEMRKSNPELPAHVIPRDGDKPVQLFDCPYDDCDGELHGQVEECEDCEREIHWQDDDE